MILNDKTNIVDSSKLGDLCRCPRFYFYRHILGWESEQPSNHLVFGESWHLPMEHLLLNGYDQKSVAEGYFLFEKKYRSTFPPESDEMFEPKIPYNAMLTLAEYANRYHRDLDDFEVLYTEIGGSVSISENRQIHFRMDSILRDKKTGNYFSMEHKTGSRTWLWAEQWLLSIQIGTYSHVLYCLFPKDSVSGVMMNGTFFLKRKKDPFDFMRPMMDRSVDQLDVWLANVNSYFDFLERQKEILLKEGEDSDVLSAFPQNPTGCLNFSRICEYMDFCTAWKNPLRHAFEPPLGFIERFWDPREKEKKHEFNI